MIDVIKLPFLVTRAVSLLVVAVTFNLLWTAWMLLSCLTYRLPREAPVCGVMLFWVPFVMEVLLVGTAIYVVGRILWRRYKICSEVCNDSALICMRQCENRLHATQAQQEQLHKAVTTLSDAVKSKLENGDATTH
jgi:hypothetical protein